MPAPSPQADPALSFEPEPPTLPSSIAPWPHTLALLLVLTFFAVSGYLRSRIVPSTAGYTLRALSTIVWQFLLLGGVIAGIYQRGVFFHTTLFRRSIPRRSEAWAGSLTYVAGLGVIVLCGLALHPLHLAHRNSSVLVAMMPGTAADFIPWFALSLTAGLCEELIFRGYLLQQFTAISRRKSLAIAATSLLFGFMHLYEGPLAVVALTFLAVLYAIVTLRRGNIVAAVIAHAAQDFLAAFLFLSLHRS